MTEMVCEYCGRPKWDRLTCCGEYHWVHTFDWRKADRAWDKIQDAIDASEDNPFEPRDPD